MKTLRQLHIYLGVFFAPVLIYFAISGAWQVFRFNDLPKEGDPSSAQKVLHALSEPHVHATLPGNDGKKQQSFIFKIFEVLMAAGFIITSVLGIKMAFQLSRQRRAITWTLIAGATAPVLFLLLHFGS